MVMVVSGHGWDRMLGLLVVVVVVMEIPLRMFWSGSSLRQRVTRGVIHSGRQITQRHL
jgi:hypothetical protein